MSTTPPPNRSIGGLDSNVVGALAYAGGLISGVVLLALEKRDDFVRFHALQSTITFLAVLVFYMMLTGVPVVGAILRVPFVLATVALWAWLINQAFHERRYKLPYVGEFVEHQLAKARRP